MKEGEIVFSMAYSTLGVVRVDSMVDVKTSITSGTKFERMEVPVRVGFYHENMDRGAQVANSIRKQIKSGEPALALTSTGELVSISGFEVEERGVFEDVFILWLLLKLKSLEDLDAGKW